MRCGTIRCCMKWHDMIQLSKCTYTVFTVEVWRRVAQRQEARPWWGALQRRRKIFGKSLLSNEVRDFNGHCMALRTTFFSFFTKAWAASGTFIRVSAGFQNWGVDNKQIILCIRPFHKVVGICLPWNSLTLTFMKPLFWLKCYILECVGGGTDSEGLDLLFFLCFQWCATCWLHWFWRGFHSDSSYPSLSIISDLFLACKPDCIPLSQPSR